MSSTSSSLPTLQPTSSPTSSIRKNLLERLPCFKPAEQESPREFRINDEDSQFSSYSMNKIKTSRYTWYNFIFINLYEQLHRVANIYFILLTILQFIPEISSLNPTTTLIPIAFVLLFTGAKDGYDDLYRHKSDRSVNQRTVKMLRHMDGEDARLVEGQWQEVKVGDILLVANNEAVPADLLLLTSSDQNGLVYVDTAELDGETNLKVRQATPFTNPLEDDLEKLSKFRATIKCEAPNNILHKLTGTLSTGQDQTIPVDNQNILLRGCTIRNTQWCFGTVVYAGPDTKLMQNTGRTMLKRTSIDREMNRLVILIFFFLIITATISAIASTMWEASIGKKFQLFMKWPPYIQSPNFIGFLTFWSYTIILNTVVPISLYVSIEFIRLGQSYFIDSDQMMYYEPKNLPAHAHTTTLNEELGQVEYIFSDKTGTLTQNIMIFNKCSISGMMYGSITDQSSSQSQDPVDFSSNPFSEPNFRFYDQRLMHAARDNDDVIDFFRLLAICHTVMPESNLETGALLYQAQSPDEGALVSAARNFGFVFKSRTHNTISIIEHGEEKNFQVLAILDFDNVRKRMSVIVEDDAGVVTLYCKGADSVIYERLSSEDQNKIKQSTTDHLNGFASEGLRTLCLAKKRLNRDELEVWMKAYEEASRSLEDREENLSSVYEEIERDLELMGATAIEDKLQDGVPETIRNLSKANIKIWVLTGDKQETAINIGYSCNMLSESMKEVFIINSHSSQQIEALIDEALMMIQNDQNYDTCRQESPNHHPNGLDKLNPGPSNLSTSEDFILEDKDTYGLVIDGLSLSFALEESIRLKFLELASSCSAVICCRVTPLQKANVVQLVKENKKVVTLAIGDGANDVSMIKAAHIGVGISGEEGTQAVLSSDFSFGQFRFLERLLLVHGRWSYMRICKFLNYFFYKNFAFTLMQLWYACFNGFTAQTVFDPWFVTYYNIFYTSQPILWLAVIEQDLNPEFCIRFPRLYVPGQKNEFFNTKLFLKSIFRGIIVSLVIFFVNYGAFYVGVSVDGINYTDYQIFSTSVSTSLIFVVTFQVAVETRFWTFLNHFFTWGSIIVFFIFTFAMHSSGLFALLPASFGFVGSALTAFTLPTLWFTSLISLAVCILPEILKESLKTKFRPTYSEIVLQKQIRDLKLHKSRRSPSDVNFVRVIKKKLRHSFPRSSHRLNSGYAFSQERGFGELITTGRMSMRSLNRPSTLPPMSTSVKTLSAKKVDHQSSVATSHILPTVGSLSL